jgi:hypothetical protein
MMVLGGFLGVFRKVILAVIRVSQAAPQQQNLLPKTVKPFLQAVEDLWYAQ